MSKKEKQLNISDLPEDTQATEDEMRKVKGGAFIEPNIARMDNPTTATGTSPTTNKLVIGTSEPEKSTTLNVNLNTFGTTDPKP